MFTGIVKEIGVIDKSVHKGTNRILYIRIPETIKKLCPGDSVSVNGVCLTVSGLSDTTIKADLLEETVKQTNLGSLKIGDKVNIEPALKVGDRLSGHFVTGHIDGVVNIASIIKKYRDNIYRILISKELQKYIVSKGSVALDGVSLTIDEITQKWFTVNIIPHTLQSTTLAYKKIGDKVNIEVDILAKYVRKSVGK